MSCPRILVSVGRRLAFLVAGCMLVCPLTTKAQRIKLATLAPTGSSYYHSLLAMRDAWRQASQGRIKLIVYGDGKLGGEADTVGLMSLNSIQAAMLTAVGLSQIEKGVAGLQSIPMGFDSFAEVDYVGAKLHPTLEKLLVQKGFVVLFWVDAGWIHFFSKEPVSYPDDLKKLKLFTWAGNPDENAIYRDAGLNPVPLETADILPGLQTGLIDAVPAPPVFALASQIDTRAPYMLDLKWAPLVGACVIRKQTWDRIPATLHPALLAAAAQAGRDIRQKSRQEMKEAVAAMEKRGLKVTRATPAIVAAWRKAAVAVYPQIRGTIVPAPIFDQALALIQEYRATKAK